IALRDRVLASLPYYTRWLAQQPLSNEDEKLLVSLWEQVHELRKRLAPPDPAKVTAEQIAALGKTADAVRRGFPQVQKMLSDVGERADPAQQDRWHEIERALTVPFLDPVVRLRLVRASRIISQKLNEATGSATGAEGISAEKNADQARATALRQG